MSSVPVLRWERSFPFEGGRLARDGAPALEGILGALAAALACFRAEADLEPEEVLLTGSIPTPDLARAVEGATRRPAALWDAFSARSFGLEPPSDTLAPLARSLTVAAGLACPERNWLNLPPIED